jgi:hypothetical protein
VNDWDCDDTRAWIFPSRSCDDGDPCTQNERCAYGECAGIIDPACAASENCSSDCSNLGGADCCVQTGAGNGASCPTNASCDILCTEDDCQNLDCASGSTCTVEANGVSGGPTMLCDDALCDFQCQSTTGGCNATCQDGATCKLDCDESSGECNLTCASGSTCYLQCDPSSGNCNLDCPSGNACIMDCSGAPAGCDFTPCADGTGMTCSNSFITCNLPCP